MRNPFQLFRKNSITVHIIAAAMIICMGLADASLYIGYALGQKDVDDDLRIVTEEHEIDFALADGEYNGSNSDSENPKGNPIESNTGKSIFNILEILPSESKGVIGYMISGCMPFENAKGIKSGDEYIVTPQQMKEAYMDALANKTPGKDNESMGVNGINNDFKQLKEQLYVQGGIKPYDFVGGYYDGYYKYVGKNNGVFAKGEETTYWNNGNKTDIVMYSRFYDYSPSRSYDYIFVWDDPPSASTQIGTPIPVTGHRRNRCVNYEKFIKEYLGESDADTWRRNHICEVTTKTPSSVSLDDIERADIIFIRDAGDDIYYQHARPLNNLVNGKESGYGQGERFATNDFDDFEKVVKIYERVVIRKDVAIIVEKIPAYRTTGNIQSNIHKLIAMLFYVKVGVDGKYGSGREFFTDFMKRYTSNPGDYTSKVGDNSYTYAELRKQYDEHRTSSDTKLYPDYRAMSLRTTEDKTSPAYYYMHYNTPYHVGHPLVLNESDAIIGGSFDENGNLKPITVGESGGSAPRERLIRRNEFMFKDADIDYEKGTVEDGDDTITVFYHDYAYDSMSNTTDYAYIDDNGNLVIDDKYSSKKGYWFKIDYDGGINGQYAYRRILWDREELKKWPWDSDLSYWLHARRESKDDTYFANLHMWYDYNAFRNDKEKIKALGTDTSENFGEVYTYENECLVQENHLFKTADQNFIKSILDKREVKREKEDNRHVDERDVIDYYISMNIINGDGFNKKSLPGQNNKTLYYNQYEVKRDPDTGAITDYPDIPLRIKVRSTCPIVSISVKTVTPSNTLVSFPLNYDVSKGKDKVNSSSGSYTLKLTSDTDDGHASKSTDPPYNTPIYTFIGEIPKEVVALTHFYEKRNVKFKVEMTAKLPNDTELPVDDTITIVRRDFFMLD